MPSKIFSSIVSEKVDTFYNSYINVSKRAFFDDRKVIHPGEYGKYRERICIELLKMFVPGRVSIGDGFIITNTDKVSTQCDLVIYDKLASPRIKTNEEQTFYPIESVVGVIEVKSILSLGDFKKSLEKLAKIKSLRNEVGSAEFSFRKDALRGESFSPFQNASDHIFSAIICEKLDFDIKKHIDNLYPSKIKLHDRHNIVLSLEDGELSYNLSGHDCLKKLINEPLETVSYDQPAFVDRELVNCFSESTENKKHIKAFLDSFTRRAHETTVMIPEIVPYTEGFDLATKRKSFDLNK